MDSKTGHIDVPATEIAIKKLNHYSEQLDAFKKQLDSEVQSLGQIQLDPNFEKFYKYFQEFWPEIVKFKKDIERFNSFLSAKKEFINQEYNKIGIKKPN